MGAENRGEIFAKFVCKQFPKAQYIWDVAGGKGMVARSLANKSQIRTVFVFDPSPRWEGKPHPKIFYKGTEFIANDPPKLPLPDVIIGMHPDEATEEILEFAKEHKLRFAIVPCCQKGRWAGHRHKPWHIVLFEYCQKHSRSVRQTLLKMTGKNLVIWGEFG